MNDTSVGTEKVVEVIEDEASYQHMLSEKLGKDGFAVLSAKNGEEGLALALDRHPDLILLDLQMPKMSGIDFLTALRQDPWGKEAKVIVLTVVDDTEKIADVLGQNTFDYYLKADIKIEDLVASIKEKLGTT